MMAFALLESLVLTGILTLLSALLPPSWLRVGFDYKASLAVLIAGIASIVLQNDLGYYFPALLPLIGGTLAAFLIWTVLVVWLQRAPAAQQAITGFIERFTVFSYIYVPLGVIGLAVVLIRNLI